MPMNDQFDLIDISIIIVNWRSASYTRQCLRSIYAKAVSFQLEVIVVDNASYDGCKDIVETEFPQVTFIQSEQNLGFAGANNLGFSRSRGKKILFLNPDTEVQDLALQKLAAALDELEDAGLVGARLLNSDLTLQTTCVVAFPSILNSTLNSDFLRKRFPHWPIWGMTPLFTSGSSPVTVEAISGACMFGKREVISQVGAFTQDYFMYSEDMDLCFKITRAGWRIYYVPEAKIVHHAAGSSSSRDEEDFSTIMTRESLMRFMELHRSSAYATLYKITSAAAAACRIVLLGIALLFHPSGHRQLFRSLKKWSRVLAWCFGLASWATRQSPSTRSTEEPVVPKVLTDSIQ